ncbi:feruloyl esterase B precursor protein [Colletotrichum tofieldiae]|nr:feruloyl esterase B precursor protein [Colletotrichum tofieldiae]GKT82115.1 feruloyl esterase B precursor protein [Colletotrichum tofieldiae]
MPTYNYTATSLPPGSTSTTAYTISFWNVSVTYTHPGTNDAVNVQVWLPSPSTWNGRLQAVGGGGYSASFGSLYMTQAVGHGYVALDTDAGHFRGAEYAQSPKEWVLESPGKVNTHLVDNWGSTSLHEMAVIGKAVSESYYGTKPRYSYFTGCSGGGRQAMMIAQKYAKDFDGLMAAAPAINIEHLIPAGYWASQVMLGLGVGPPPCEFEAFTQAAVDSCDALDGAKDGIISLPALCRFDPHSIVGQNFSCNGTKRQYTLEAATIVQAAWTGARSDDSQVGWFGLNKDASLTSTYISTQCTSNSTCTATSASILAGWIQYFSAKDSDWDASTMTKEQFLAYLQQSDQDYSSLLAADNPDLSAFRAAGSKMITWHGLADEVIPPNGTIAYMEQVLKANPNSHEFIRFYEAPGVGHCYGGAGAAPKDAFAQLVLWVENGTVPTTLTATDSAGNQRELCTFPLQQVYLGGNLSDSASFGCSLSSEEGTPANELPFY